MVEKVSKEVSKKISVIVPVFNAAKHLRECLDSVCNQSVGDYEVICVDDCSSDQSLTILKEYQQKYAMLKVVRQSHNMGAGPARNRGIKLAQGDYIAFLDADDYYQNKDSLKSLYTQAIENDADICGGGLRYADSTKNKRAAQYCFQDNGWIDFRDYQQYYYYQRFIFRRSLLITNDIFFPNYLRFQDPPFFVRAMLAAERFYAVKKLFYVYREDGAHVSWNVNKVNDLMQGHMDVLKLCMDHHLDKLLYDMLKRELENKYFHNIMEMSLGDGNVKVAEFYHFVLSCANHVLISDMPALNLQYAQAIDSWNRRTNMTYYHRPIALVDKQCAPAPCVSVVIPVFNTDQYVASCIDSIQNQTLKNIEVICIDDGSTDQSGIILDEYERKYTNIRVYHQENQGLSAARNAGLQHVQGAYVYFMDSDDYLLPNALEVLYQRAIEDNLDVVFFGAQSFFDEQMTEEDKKESTLPIEYNRAGNYASCMPGTQMLCEQNENSAYYTPVWIQLVNTSFLRTEGIAFYESILHEDNLYTLQLMFRAKRTGCVNEPFFQRRIRSNSIMTTQCTHRNILGMYLTVVELMREFDYLSQYKKELQVLLEKMQAMILNSIARKWPNLPSVERALFLGSLTKEDRMMFNALVIPVITLCSVGKGKNTDPKLQRAMNMGYQRGVYEAKNTKTYLAGRVVLWLPKQVIAFGNSMRSSGMRVTLKRIRRKLTALPVRIGEAFRK